MSTPVPPPLANIAFMPTTVGYNPDAHSFAPSLIVSPLQHMPHTLE